MFNGGSAQTNLDIKKDKNCWKSLNLVDQDSKNVVVDDRHTHTPKLGLSDLLVSES